MHVELATISTISPIRGRPRLVVRPRSEYRMSEQGPRFPANTPSHTHTHTHTFVHYTLYSSVLKCIVPCKYSISNIYSITYIYDIIHAHTLPHIHAYTHTHTQTHTHHDHNRTPKRTSHWSIRNPFPLSTNVCVCVCRLVVKRVGGGGGWERDLHVSYVICD